MRAQITLKSGAQIEVEVEEITTRRDPVSDIITKISWTTPAGWKRKLHTLSPSEIAAVVVIEDVPFDPTNIPP